MLNYKQVTKFIGGSIVIAALTFSMAEQLLSSEFADGNTVKIEANAHRFSFEKIK